MPSISYSSSAKAAPCPEAGRAIGLVIVVPAASGEDSHFDSRKSRLSEVAVQRRADRGGGSAHGQGRGPGRRVLERPGDLRHRPARGGMAEERSQAVHGPVAVHFQAVARVGDLDHVLRALQVVPVEVEGVERPVGVVRPVDQHLGHASGGRGRCRGRPSSRAWRRRPVSSLLHQPAADVVLDLLAVLAPDLELVWVPGRRC